MYNRDNLKNLEKLVISRAEDEKNQVLQELSERLSEKLSHHENILKADLERELKDNKREIGQKQARQLAAKSFNGKKEYFIARESLITELFADVSEKLSEFSKTEGYIKLMSKRIDKATADKSHTYKIAVSAEDKLLLEYLDKNGINYEAIERNFIGGCRVIDETEGTLTDLTFANALKAESDSFLEEYFNMN